jgi:hypothetical protein
MTQPSDVWDDVKTIRRLRESAPYTWLVTSIAHRMFVKYRHRAATDDLELYSFLRSFCGDDPQPAALLATGETDLECDVPEDTCPACGGSGCPACDCEPDSYSTLPDVERPSGRS